MKCIQTSLPFTVRFQRSKNGIVKLFVLQFKNANGGHKPADIGTGTQNNRHHPILEMISSSTAS